MVSPDGPPAGFNRQTQANPAPSSPGSEVRVGLGLSGKGPSRVGEAHRGSQEEPHVPAQEVKRRPAQGGWRSPGRGTQLDQVARKRLCLAAILGPARQNAVNQSRAIGPRWDASTSSAVGTGRRGGRRLAP